LGHDRRDAGAREVGRQQVAERVLEPDAARSAIATLDAEALRAADAARGRDPAAHRDRERAARAEEDGPARAAAAARSGRRAGEVGAAAFAALREDLAGRGDVDVAGRDDAQRTAARAAAAARDPARQREDRLATRVGVLQAVLHLVRRGDPAVVVIEAGGV